MSIKPMNWIERRWNFDLEPGLFSNILERLRGTPVRASELVADFPDAALKLRFGKSWSAQEHIAHLDDLHELDERRLSEFAAGADILTAADMGNSRTEEAQHNQQAMSAILERFRRQRSSLVTQLEPLDESAILHECEHARLGKRLRLIDWVYFVAEHDDHHLAQARRVLQSAAGG